MRPHARRRRPRRRCRCGSRLPPSPGRGPLAPRGRPSPRAPARRRRPRPPRRSGRCRSRRRSGSCRRSPRSHRAMPPSSRPPRSSCSASDRWRWRAR
ncbi:MAG: hypothetical protein E6J03_06555 [Chloroflexi bacterium]|nr:MAG: hypothetical protein E6J03_06555 [Chloroflexota bacterium]